MQANIKKIKKQNWQTTDSTPDLTRWWDKPALKALFIQLTSALLTWVLLNLSLALLGTGESLFRLDDEAGALWSWEQVTRLPENPSSYAAWRQVAAARVRAGTLRTAFAAYKEAEHRAASSVKDRKEWSYERWTEEVTKVLQVVENAIWPDLFIAGGGISRKADKWIPLLKNRTPVVAAALLNTAGIVGAAMATELGNAAP